MKKIVALIPARSGSKRIKNKNIVLVDNHPLVSYSLAAARSSKLIDEVYVSTDSSKIAKIANKYGAKTPFLRPKSISKDNSIDSLFFNHFLSYLKKNNFTLPELIVHLSPTVPFREYGVIDKAIKYLKKYPKSTSLRSVNKIPLSPYKIFQKKGLYLKGFFSNIKYEYYNMPKQKFPETYLPNGQVDIIKTKQIKKNSLHGNNMLSYNSNPSLDIDHPEDLLKIKSYIDDSRYSYLKKYLI